MTTDCSISRTYSTVFAAMPLSATAAVTPTASSPYRLNATVWAAYAAVAPPPASFPCPGLAMFGPAARLGAAGPAGRRAAGRRPARGKVDLRQGHLLLPARAARPSSPG